MKRFFKLLRDRSGSAAIEFGAIGGLMSIFTLGVVDVGNMVRLSMQANYAAEAGASYAFRNGFDATQISTAVTTATRANVVSANPGPSEFYGCATDTGITVVSNASTPCPNSTLNPGLYAMVQAAAIFTPVFNTSLFNYPSSLNATSIVRIQ